MAEQTLAPPQEAAQEPMPVTKPEEHREETTLSEYLESLLVTVILALFGTTFIVQAFKIPSASMEGTLLIGDHLLVNKFIFGGTGAWYEKLLPYRQLERGDIIVFKYPYADHQHFVKRVIGLPGDRLKVVDGDVYINGKKLNEPYALHDASVFADPFNYSFPPLRGQMISPNTIPEWRPEIRKYVQGDEIVVPPGRYFAMGDNRDHSQDSRYWGFVDRDATMGGPCWINCWVEGKTATFSGVTRFGYQLTAFLQTMFHR